MTGPCPSTLARLTIPAPNNWTVNTARTTTNSASGPDTSAIVPSLLACRSWFFQSKRTPAPTHEPSLASRRRSITQEGPTCPGRRPRLVQQSPSAGPFGLSRGVRCGTPPLLMPRLTMSLCLSAFRRVAASTCIAIGLVLLASALGRSEWWRVAISGVLPAIIVTWILGRAYRSRMHALGALTQVSLALNGRDCRGLYQSDCRRRRE